MIQLLRRAWYLVRQRQLERDFNEELEFHRALKQRELEDAGLTPTDAGFAAHRTLGSTALAANHARDVWIAPWLQDLSHDVRFAARLLAKDRWFTLATLLVLALGISVNNTVFTMVNAALLRALPFHDPDRLVAVGTHDALHPPIRSPETYRGVSYLEYQDWRITTNSFVGMGAYIDATMNVSDDRLAPERFQGAYVSANAFALLGRQPLLGRDFRPEDDQAGAPAVVILGHRVWINRYRGDHALIGRTIRVNGTPSIIVGVMPPVFGFPLTADLWQPLALLPGLDPQHREARTLSAFGRLAPRATMAEAQAELDALATGAPRDSSDTQGDVRSTVWPYADRYIAPQMKLILLTLMGAVAFVLLITCANVANLLLARSARRSHEISVRTSLGATPWRIVRQLLVESLLLAGVGGIAGYALSMLGVKLLWNVIAETNPPFWIQLTMDGRTLPFLVVLCGGTGLVFGLAPALHLSRAHTHEALKEGPRTGTASRRVRRWTSALVIAEIALTLVLLAGAGFMLHAFLTAYRAYTNIDASRLLTLQVDLPSLKYPTPEQRAEFYGRLERRVATLPGVSSATVASRIPFGGAPSRQLAIDGRPVANGENPPLVPMLTIGSEYFRTLDLPVLRGRAFGSADGTSGLGSAIVNQRFVTLYFPKEDPIGHRIRLSNPQAGGTAAPWLTIVGVCSTLRRDALCETCEVTAPREVPFVYLPYRAQPDRSTALIVRARTEPGVLVAVLREEVRSLDPDLPVFDIRTVEEWLGFLRWPERVFGTMVAIFACLALILSGVGLYAVTAYSVKQRTHEIGVRMASERPHRKWDGWWFGEVWCRSLSGSCSACLARWA